MAPKKPLIFFFFLLLSSFVIAAAAHPHELTTCPFDRIYSFGGSSDSDRLASKLHLPLPKPYSVIHGENMFDHGASFTSPEATVMSPWFFFQNGIQPKPLNQSLHKQIKSFTALLSPYCFPPERFLQKFDRALFYFDQLGVQDYQHMFVHGKSIMEVSKLVPQVTEAIKGQLEGLIRLGARNLFVSGSPPIGCSPTHPMFLGRGNIDHYDSNKCNIGLNTFATLHNDHLQQALYELRRDFPRVRVVYMDYFKAFMRGNHDSPGFNIKRLVKACPGTKNINPGKQYCEVSSPVCSDPATNVQRDGSGSTHKAAIRKIVDSFLQFM